MAYVMVLDDGETYSGVDNCSIVEVPDHFDGDDIEAFLDQLNTDDPAAFVATFTVGTDGPRIEQPNGAGPQAIVTPAYRTTPMTVAEIEAAATEPHGYIDVVVAMDLWEMAGKNDEVFHDIASEKAVGSPLLMDVSYCVVGVTPTGEVLLALHGDPSEVLAEHDTFDGAVN